MESSKPRALAAFAAAEGRSGILVDFDGSLSPIVARPELAQIREGARDALARLVGPLRRRGRGVRSHAAPSSRP